jgi:hypothetical protein
MTGMLQLAGIQRQPAAGQVDDLVEATEHVRAKQSPAIDTHPFL